MNYISLPDFYWNKEFNNFFSVYVNLNKDKLKTDISIEYFYGSFPWSLWNGGYNSNSGAAVLYDEMQRIFSNLNRPVILDCSNINLTDNDLYDRHMNTILSLADNGSNMIEFSDFKVFDYITNLYSNYHFVLSRGAELFNDFDSDIINLILENDKINLINLNLPIENIQNKNKIELMIGNCCQYCSNKQQLDCIYKEQCNQYNFSEYTNYVNCINSIPNFNYLDQIQHYNKMGYTHFKIMPQQDYTKLQYFNLTLIKNFIKEEYQIDCIKEYLNYKERL